MFFDTHTIYDIPNLRASYVYLLTYLLMCLCIYVVDMTFKFRKQSMHWCKNERHLAWVIAGIPIFWTPRPFNMGHVNMGHVNMSHVSMSHVNMGLVEWEILIP